MANTKNNQGNQEQHGVKGQGGMQGGNSVPGHGSNTANAGNRGMGGSMGGMGGGGSMKTGGQEGDEQATGTPNIEYDLVSILYHALQGGETYAQYLEDCKDLGDEELTGFIHECIEQEKQRAEKAKRILMRHMGGQQSKGAGSETENAGM